MLKAILLVLFIFCCISFISLSLAKVRTAYLNDKKMEKVTLNMGKSTVLRFMEKPKKIVIGNQNYFNVEFINNDVTLQPQGIVNTNLFVYCENNTYGFVINVTAGGYCDDLVKIKWKPETRGILRQSSKIKKVFRLKKVEVIVQFDGLLKILIDSIWFNKKRNLYLMDLILKNEAQKSIKLSEIKLNLKKEGKRILKQFHVCKSEEVAPQEAVRIRMFTRLEKKKKFSIDIEYQGKKKTVTIQKKYL